MRIVKQNRFKNLGELPKEWTEAGFKASRATTQTCQGIWLQLSSEVSYLGSKNWTVAQSSFLFSDESKLCISFGNQGPRVCRKGGEAHSPSCLKSSVKFPQSVMIWGAMSSAGVGPLCFLKTSVTVQFTNNFWSTSCFLLLTSFLNMLISFSSMIYHLPILPKAQKVG